MRNKRDLDDVMKKPNEFADVDAVDSFQSSVAQKLKQFAESNQNNNQQANVPNGQSRDGAPKRTKRFDVYEGQNMASDVFPQEVLVEAPAFVQTLPLYRPPVEIIDEPQMDYVTRLHMDVRERNQITHDIKEASAENDVLYEVLRDGFQKLSKSQNVFNDKLKKSIFLDVMNQRNVELKDLLTMLSNIDQMISTRRVYLEKLLKENQDRPNHPAYRSIVEDIESLSDEWNQLNVYKNLVIDRIKEIGNLAAIEYRDANNNKVKVDCSLETLLKDAKDSSNIFVQKRKEYYEIRDSIKDELNDINADFVRNYAKIDQYVYEINKRMASQSEIDEINYNIKKLNEHNRQLVSRKDILKLKLLDSKQKIDVLHKDFVAKKELFNTNISEHRAAIENSINKLIQYSNSLIELQNDLNDPDSVIADKFYTAKQYIESRIIEFQNMISLLQSDMNSSKMQSEVDDKAVSIKTLEEDIDRLQLESKALDFISSTGILWIERVVKQIENNINQLHVVSLNIEDAIKAKNKEFDELTEPKTASGKSVDFKFKNYELVKFFDDKQYEIEQLILSVNKAALSGAKRQDVSANIANLQKIKAAFESQRSKFESTGSFDLQTINGLNSDLLEIGIELELKKMIGYESGNVHQIFSNVKQKLQEEQDNLENELQNRFKHVDEDIKYLSDLRSDINEHKSNIDKNFDLLLDVKMKLLDNNTSAPSNQCDLVMEDWKSIKDDLLKLKEKNIDVERQYNVIKQGLNNHLDYVAAQIKDLNRLLTIDESDINSVRLHDEKSWSSPNYSAIAKAIQDLVSRNKVIAAQSEKLRIGNEISSVIIGQDQQESNNRSSYLTKELQSIAQNRSEINKECKNLIEVLMSYQSKFVTISNEINQLMLDFNQEQAEYEATKNNSLSSIKLKINDLQTRNKLSFNEIKEKHDRLVQREKELDNSSKNLADEFERIRFEGSNNQGSNNKEYQDKISQLIKRQQELLKDRNQIRSERDELMNRFKDAQKCIREKDETLKQRLANEKETKLVNEINRKNSKTLELEKLIHSIANNLSSFNDAQLKQLQTLQNKYLDLMKDQKENNVARSNLKIAYDKYNTDKNKLEKDKVITSNQKNSNRYAYNNLLMRQLRERINLLNNQMKQLKANEKRFDLKYSNLLREFKHLKLDFDKYKNSNTIGHVTTPLETKEIFQSEPSAPDYSPSLTQQIMTEAQNAQKENGTYTIKIQEDYRQPNINNQHYDIDTSFKDSDPWNLSNNQDSTTKPIDTFTIKVEEPTNTQSFEQKEETISIDNKTMSDNKYKEYSDRYGIELEKQKNRKRDYELSQKELRLSEAKNKINSYADQLKIKEAVLKQQLANQEKQMRNNIQRDYELAKKRLHAASNKLEQDIKQFDEKQKNSKMSDLELKRMNYKQDLKEKKLASMFDELKSQRSELDKRYATEMATIDTQKKELQKREEQLNQKIDKLKKQTDEINNKSKHIFANEMRLKDQMDHYNELRHNIAAEQRKLDEAKNKAIEKLNNFNSDLDRKKNKLKSLYERIQTVRNEQNEKQKELDNQAIKNEDYAKKLKEIKFKIESKEKDLQLRRQNEIRRISDIYRDIANRQAKLSQIEEQLELKKEELESNKNNNKENQNPIKIVSKCKVHSHKGEKIMNNFNNNDNNCTNPVCTCHDNISGFSPYNSPVIKFSPYPVNDQVSQALQLQQLIQQQQIHMLNQEHRMRLDEANRRKDELEFKLKEIMRWQERARDLRRHFNCAPATREGRFLPNETRRSEDSERVENMLKEIANSTKDKLEQMQAAIDSIKQKQEEAAQNQESKVVIQQPQATYSAIPASSEIDFLEATENLNRQREELNSMEARNMRMLEEIRRMVRMQRDSFNHERRLLVDEFRRNNEIRNQALDEKEKQFQLMLHQMLRNFNSELSTIRKDKQYLMEKLATAKNYTNRARLEASQEAAQAKTLLEKARQILLDERKHYADEREKLIRDLFVSDKSKDSLSKSMTESQNKKNTISKLNEEIKNIKDLLNK